MSATNLTCYLHIGPHKTASSTIQQFVRENETELRRQKLVYPSILRDNGKVARSHQILGTAVELTPEGDLAPGARFWTVVDEIARRGDTNILISHESLVSRLAAPGVLDRVLNYFAKRGYAVVAIAYVRDQPGWLNSWYVQGQKRLSGLQSFDVFVEKFIEQGHVEPARYLAPFLNEPRLRVEPVSFERAARDGLEMDFIRRCGVEEVGGLVTPPIRNVNAGAKTVYAARRIMTELGGRARDREGYGKVYMDFKTTARSLGWDGKPFIALDQALYERIRARYAESNDLFARQWFGAAWEELAPPRRYEPSLFEPETASREEIEEIEAVVDRAVRAFAKKAAKGKGNGGNKNAEAA
ncbi:hypothetical protein [Methylopila sp. M107]|uniref:hypothetical protein n=1 Tax=Methylopila sp. M107 TaxID=1101190 RepID=UPI00036C5F14|nr:hypothetical protein [Methylopila sp. M107]